MGYTYEIEEANACLRSGKLESPQMEMGESLDMAILMDEIRKQVGVSYPADEQSFEEIKLFLLWEISLGFQFHLNHLRHTISYFPHVEFYVVF
jgi:hypothetical protein